jgi:serine/threonine protein kinase
VNDGKLLIADFGLSKKLTEVTSNSMANKMGLIQYMDPQCLKIKNYKKDKKSDIYSLGVLLWEITSGSPPFSELTEFMLGSYIINNVREEPIEGTPLEYQELYQKCWKGDPNLRPNIDQAYEILNKLISTFNTNRLQATVDEILSVNDNSNTQASDGNFTLDDL